MIYVTRLPETQPDRNQRQLLHKTAWALLEFALREKAPEVVLQNSLRFGLHGKPWLENGPCFSLSHTKGLALCAVEDWNTGVDAEYRRVFPSRLRMRVFTSEERQTAEASADADSVLTTLWTLKESHMKYTGLGLAQGAESLQFRMENGQPVLDGAEVFFCTTIWQGYHISQCGPQPFKMKLRPVDFYRLSPG